MLLCNKGRRLQTNCCRITGGNAVSGIYGLGLSGRKLTREGVGARFNQAFGEHTTSGVNIKAGVPNGYRHPGWWVVPISSGSLASINEIDGAGTFAGAIAGGKNAESSLTGSGDASATGQLIVSMVAAITASGTITEAAAVAYLQLAAELAGEGDIDGALSALGHALGSLSGSGSVTSTATAKGVMEAGITVTGDLLTTANIADTIWGAIAEGNFTYAQCLQIISAAVGGKTSNSGQTFRDLSDTKDRIVGTVSGGERSDVTYDVD